MNRRHFIISSVALGGIAGAGAGLWITQLQSQKDLSVTTLLKSLATLSAQNNKFTGLWNAFQTFSHLAQSIEYSMSGYPEHKSELFKSIVGKAAFNLFAKQGSMSHALDEPIPGANSIPNLGLQDQALGRLRNALQRFENFEGKLLPHFAYGHLSHHEYSLAHVMHVYNHLEELEAPVVS